MEETMLKSETLSLTQQNMLAYFQTHDVKYVAEDAVFRNLNTCETYTGRAEIGGMLHFFYHVLFDAKAEMDNYLITEDKAMVEGRIVGKHIGEMNGIPPTGKEVNFPICVTYRLKDGLIKAANIYSANDVLMQQLGINHATPNAKTTYLVRDIFQLKFGQFKAAKGLLNDPFEHCHFVTSTTHKTLRGPRGGIILMGKDFENPFGAKDPKGNIRMMSSLLDLAVFPGIQGGPLEHVIAAKAIAFGEILDDSYTQYAKQIQRNAQAMARAFVAKDYGIISNGTDNHLMLIDLRNKNITGKKAQETLDKAHITLNKNAVPFDDKSPFVTSGIRVGVPAVTTRGMKEEHMQTVVDLIDRVLMNIDDENLIKKTADEVHGFMEQFPLYPELS